MELLAHKVFDMVSLRDGKETVVPEEKSIQDPAPTSSEEMSSSQRSVEDRLDNMEKMIASLNASIQQLMVAQANAAVPIALPTAPASPLPAVNIPVSLSSTPTTWMPTTSAPMFVDWPAVTFSDSATTQTSVAAAVFSEAAVVVPAEATAFTPIGVPATV